ncbi:DUF4331 family protein [Candidatus Riflebacteria bacterium]
MKVLFKSIMFSVFLNFIFAQNLVAADRADSPTFGDIESSNFVPNTADITDLYCWVEGSNLVLVMCVMPMQPSISSINTENISKYLFDPEVSYQFHIDNSESPDGTAEYVIKCRFSQALSPDYRQFIKVNSSELGISNLEGEINTAYPSTNATTAKTVTSSDGTIKIFAGPRDDPFFFDYTGMEKIKAKIGTFTGADTFAGYNVSAIVIELPLSKVLSSSHSSLAIWCTTYK